MAHLRFPSTFGVCGLSWNERGLTRFELPDDARGNGNAPAVEPVPDWIDDIIRRARRHFAGEFQDFTDVPRDLSRVSDFQNAVYAHTLAVPAGRTTSYGEIATALGLSWEGARAVGTALGSNPWPLIVPCHRVVAASGKMTGFSSPGGIRTKTRLLALEGAELLSE